MDTSRNHLVDPHLESLQELHDELTGDMPAGEDLVALAAERAEKRMRRLEASGYTRVPRKLDHAARCALQGRASATVSRISKGKLSKWAAAQRARR